MKPRRYVIGLDGGGTKTAAEMCDSAGNVLASISGAPSNFQVIGVEQASRTIVDLVETCCHSVGCSVGEIGAVLAGLTGAGRPTDQRRMAKAVRSEAAKRGIRLRNVAIESDARIALEGAFSGGPGIIVIAGTGSIVFGKNSRGSVFRSGGWGRIIGDEGSGYAMGRELFRAVAAAIDGRGRKTRLTRMLGQEFGLKTQPDIIRAIYKENFDIASAAPLVTKASASKDPVARGIVRAAAEDLVAVIAPVAERLAPRGRSTARIPLVFVGSVLTTKNDFSAAVRRSLRRGSPRVTVLKPKADPVHGASLMAIHRL